MEKSLQEVENEIVDEFSMFDEWLDKYEYLIELGKSLKDYPESSKTDENLIKGCQSRVWLDYKVEDGKILFNADSDAIITKGIDFSVVDRIGLKENLSPTRANGLVSMISKIREIAAEIEGAD